jgi:hypothetical protein
VRATIDNDGHVLFSFFVGGFADNGFAAHQNILLLFAQLAVPPAPTVGLSGDAFEFSGSLLDWHELARSMVPLLEVPIEPLELAPSRDRALPKARTSVFRHSMMSLCLLDDSRPP